MRHHLEDGVRRELHPEAPMRYEPRLPLGCDQQGRYPEVADVRIDPNEVDELGVKVPEPEPWWPYVLGAAIGLLVFALVFGVAMEVGK